MSNMDIHCVKFCNRKEHGDFITAALTKRAVANMQLAAYLNYTCVLCGSSRDADGRTALHMAASCGRTELCRWLICQKQAKMDEKDTESGYTALHRSIFCGKIDTAVTLIQLGANLNILDCNDLSPLDHAMQDNLSPIASLHSPYIYVWGSNANYTLGPNQARHHPEIMDTFHKLYPHSEPKQIYLEKFHTLILTTSGEVYSFGNGLGGRLGLGSEKTVLEPMEIKFVGNNNAISKITSCAIGRDHCLFLTDANEVWSCGLNTYHVLGITPTPAQLLSPRQVPKMKSIDGIACGRYHSVAWNSTVIYTWGFNGGQIGHDKTLGNTIPQPRLISYCSGQNRKIISVAASVGATAIATDKGDVYILHEFQCRAIASKLLAISSVSIYGGKLATLDEKREDLRVLALTKNGNILVWQETDPHLCRCTFSLTRLLVVRQVCLNAYGLIFITNDREIFRGKFRARRNKTQQSSKKQFHNFLDRNDCVQVQVEKVARIYGADSIVCDIEGHNFAALHLNTSANIKIIPEISTSSMYEDFAKMTNAEEVADVTFKVGCRVFPSHRFILCSLSETLGKLTSDSEVTVINKVEPEIFHEIIQYVYTGTCSLLKEGGIPQSLAKFNKTRKKQKQIARHDNPDMFDNKSAFEVYSMKKSETSKTNGTNINEINDPLRLLQEAAKKLGINTLYKDLNLFEIVNGQIKLKTDKSSRPRLLKFNRCDYPELYDVRIKAHCGNFVDAHKCILAARSEFFTNMFSMRWMSGNSENITEIELSAPLECIRNLLDYLYTDQVDLQNEDIDHILNLLVLADHILLDRLVEVCEFAVSKLITIKNVLRMLAIADMYNMQQLKESCMEHVCLNLALLLETRHLEQLNEDLLKDLTKFYVGWNKKMQQRVITPFSGAATDEMIEAVSITYPVNMDVKEVVKAPSQKSHRRRHRHQRNSTSFSLSESKDDELHFEMELQKTFQDSVLEEKMQELRVVKEVPARIRAISNAHSLIDDVCDEEDFVNLSLSSATDFPDLSSSFGSTPSDNHHQKTPKQKGKMIRVSQKERKRLSSTMSTVPEIVSESPKNPWNMNFEVASPVNATLGNILNEEKKQRDNLSRIRSKLLIYTQMEDKALEDLEKFYNVDNVFDEIIEVRRVDIGQIAAPSWIQK